MAQAERLSHAIKSAVSETTVAERLRPRLVVLPERAPAPAAGPAGQPKPALGRTIPGGDLAAPQASPADAPRRFREEVIMHDFPGNEPERCILRETMLAAIIKTGLDDPDDLLTKIPEHLRPRADGRQVAYLERICDIVAGAAVAIPAGKAALPEWRDHPG